MDNNKKIVNEINSFLMKGLWFDFEIMEYRGYDLTIMGSIDISASHDIEIIFKNVFFISLPAEWKTDTSDMVLEILEGPEAIELNQKYNVEQGYVIFKFIPEYLDAGCYVAAKEIDYNIKRS